MANSTQNNASKKPLLIAGIGNLLMGDEGLGVHFANRLEKESPPEIEILDGGTAGFHLMSSFEEYEKVILIDATLDGKKPGTIRRLKPHFSHDFPRAMSTHDIGLKDLMEGMQLLGTLPEIYLFAVSIPKIQPMKVGLSSEIESCIPKLREQVLKLAGELVNDGMVQ